MPPIADILEQYKAAQREHQLTLYHALQETLNQISQEMLGDDEWDRQKVERCLEELSDDLTEHLGERSPE